MSWPAGVCFKAGSPMAVLMFRRPTEGPLTLDAVARPTAHGPGQGVLLHLIYYVLVISLIMSCNTLPGGAENGAMYFRRAALLCEGIVCLMLWRNNRVSRTMLLAEFAWVALLVVTYLVVAIGTGTWGAGKLHTFLLCLALGPLLVHLLCSTDRMGDFARAFGNVVFVIAIVSLVLWLLGPVFRVIRPNCSIQSTWTTLGSPINVPGYFNLQYVVQYTELFGPRVARNTGFFVEAPMYSYVLTCALLLEHYIGSRRTIVEAVLAVATITTTSITGILFLLVFGSFWLVDDMRGTDERHVRMLKMLLVAAFFAASVWVGLQMLFGKLDTFSGNTRTDDFAVGLRVWGKQPLLGYGFENWTVYQTFISAFRANNVGYSNSVFPILLSGGLVFAFPFVVAFLAMLAPRDADSRQFGMLYLLVWVLTIVWDLPICAVMLAIGMRGSLHAEPDADVLHTS